MAKTLYFPRLALAHTYISTQNKKIQNNIAKNDKIAKICNENNKTHKIL